MPWDDLRYIFGEIMYGGHITDCVGPPHVQRVPRGRAAAACARGHGARRPSSSRPTRASRTTTSTCTTRRHEMPPESPPRLGSTPTPRSATSQTRPNGLFSTIAADRGRRRRRRRRRRQPAVKTMMEDLTSALPENFEMIRMNIKAKPLLAGPVEGRTSSCALQECSRMNVLLGEIRRTLIELDKGLKGQLNMSEPMEDLATAFTINEWPGRNPFAKCSWEKYAWFSKKGLGSQFLDMLARCAQLVDWSRSRRPSLSGCPGLFNPTAYLTAVTQVTARRTGNALDNMTQRDAHHDDAHARGGDPLSRSEDGALRARPLHRGRALGRADDPQHSGDDRRHARRAGVLADSKPKELLPPMPLIYIKAVMVQPTGSRPPVGYLRHSSRHLRRPRLPHDVCAARRTSSSRRSRRSTAVQVGARRRRDHDGAG